ncbi:MAG: hypothetical protein AAFY57_08830, partial [Cyanobacteria bacterium J06642_2]
RGLSCPKYIVLLHRLITLAETLLIHQIDDQEFFLEVSLSQSIAQPETSRLGNRLKTFVFA